MSIVDIVSEESDGNVKPTNMRTKVFGNNGRPVIVERSHACHQ